MQFGYFNQLAEKGGLLGLLLAISIFAIAILFKLLVKEKDEEIKEAREIEEKVTLVLREVDNTEKAILLFLQRNEK